MKKYSIILIVLSMLVGFNSARSEALNSPRSSADASTYDYLKGKQGIACNKTTSEKQLSSVSLNFNYVYRDFGAENGAPVIVSGSFNTLYAKGRLLYYALKLVPSVVNSETSEVKAVYPDYLDLLINGQSIGEYKESDNTTSNGGRLVGFTDKNFGLSHLLIQNGDLDIVVRFSFDKGAHYNDVKIFSITSANDASLTKSQFRECILEMIDQLREDISQRRAGN